MARVTARGSRQPSNHAACGRPTCGMAAAETQVRARAWCDLDVRRLAAGVKFACLTLRRVGASLLIKAYIC